MFRLIYFVSTDGYKTFDSEDYAEILVTEAMFRQMFVKIICVVDYRKQAITNKSTDYTFHSDDIDDLIFDLKYVTNF
jgi:hypothetical protein